MTTDIFCNDGNKTILVEGMYLHPPRYGMQHCIDVHIKPLLQLLKGNIRVLNIGFGTGWTASALIEECIKKNCSLEITGLEKNKEVYEQRFKTKPKIESHKYVTGEKHDSIKINIIIGDATKIMETLKEFDAIILDGWNEKKSPELYTEKFLKKCFTTLKKGGAITINTGSWNVKENAIKAGFKVETIKHGEYESLVGLKELRETAERTPQQFLKFLPLTARTTEEVLLFRSYSSLPHQLYS